MPRSPPVPGLAGADGTRAVPRVHASRLREAEGERVRVRRGARADHRPVVGENRERGRCRA
ncbi:hypothetical protein ACFPM0_15435 [Pseudonocardia sulfidoxydans]|uniref:hypothetical protein n=1 Tax=Pseudonocardia sulfidoxydans TaxID=54011 RepID=UPI00361247C3